MKKIKLNGLFLLLSLLQILVVSAQDKEKHEPKFKKTKSYTKSYTLSSSDKISLNNQFGEMKLVTWDKNEIKVDVSITGKSDKEDRAQVILDRISISDSKEGNTVSFKTKLADDKKQWKKNDKEEHVAEGMEINYLVYLPAGNVLRAENTFGKMIVPDYRGEAELTCKFGSLDAGNISNAKEISVEFGKGNVASMTGGRLIIKFSEGKVGKLIGDVKSNFEFSQVKLNIDNDSKNMDIRNSYSTVYLDLVKNLSATYDIRTSHGSFTNKSDFTIKKKEDNNDRHYGPRFDEQFNGTSGSGSCRIKANCSFGEIVAGHNLQVDLTEKKKQKASRTI